MTKTECCGPPGTIFREDVASEVHPDQAPEMTRACYTSFDYYNCKANCCNGDPTICVPNELGGFCNLENGTDFYFDDGGNRQLIDNDYWDDLHSARDNRELVEARDDYRNRYRTTPRYYVEQFYNPELYYDTTYFHQEQPDDEKKTTLAEINNSTCLEINKKEEFCLICHDSIPKNSIVRKIKCGHVFHHICCDKWLETKNTCPTCRHKL